jgi:UDP-N-acetylmuramyl pentapeptide phosphotransferase/UDP-N-acetylglucosamine-1-phosphate transferase
MFESVGLNVFLLFMFACWICMLIQEPQEGLRFLLYFVVLATLVKNNEGFLASLWLMLGLIPCYHLTPFLDDWFKK